MRLNSKNLMKKLLEKEITQNPNIIRENKNNKRSAGKCLHSLICKTWIEKDREFKQILNISCTSFEFLTAKWTAKGTKCLAKLTRPRKKLATKKGKGEIVILRLLMIGLKNWRRCVNSKTKSSWTWRKKCKSLGRLRTANRNRNKNLGHLLQVFPDKNQHRESSRSRKGTKGCWARSQSYQKSEIDQI